ncbi:MAG: metallophosphoesterase family protein [Planctomycetota bacterium]
MEGPEEKLAGDGLSRKGKRAPMQITVDVKLPEYQGLEWLNAKLPTEGEQWPKFGTSSLLDVSGDDYDPSREDVREYAKGKPWVWPARRICFLTDIHADADALFASLVASGGIRKTGPEDTAFEITNLGHETLFVFGGDTFDKGPSNLRLLRAMDLFRQRGANVVFLAGNHDVRALVGLAYIGRKEPHLAHLFVRMGKKAVPLFKEVYDLYFQNRRSKTRSRYSEKRLHEIMFPDASWWDEFPPIAREIMSEPKVKKELRRIREKQGEMIETAAQLGLTLADIYDCCLKLNEMFVQPSGEFNWYFRDMKLAHREGSFLFAHAGVDDNVASIIRREGIGGINREFRILFEQDLFELYHGSIGNTFRTKYRDIDLPFTEAGLRDLHSAGIYAIVHGHRNIMRGQRLVFREGMLNVECDCSVDCNTRENEGLSGFGAAVTIFEPEGAIVAISADYPYAKVFDAAASFPMVSFL